MSVVRFIADLHFGHKNCATWRGFQDEFYHDEKIIENWNNVVHKKDLTYILGDITMESKNDYYRLDALNGRKIVVLGNHDEPRHVEEMLKYVEKVGGMLRYSSKKYGKFFLTHCPIHPMELEYRVQYNIHGHIHEKLVLDKNSKPDKRYICVSCEHVGYTPRTLEELLGDGR